MAAFGLPDLVFDVPADPRPDAPMHHLHIAGFLPSGPTGPYVFCTAGASRAPMADGRRVEGMLAFQPAPSEQLKDPILRLLTAFSLHVQNSERPVQFGEVIRAEQDMSELSPMRGLMFAPPVLFNEAAHQLGSPKAPVELMWLVPIYDEEAQLLLARGATTLLNRFIEEETELLNFSRAPVRLRPKPAPKEKPQPEEKPQRKARKKVLRARPSARGPMISRPTPSAGAKRGYAGGAPPPKPPAAPTAASPTRGSAASPEPKKPARPRLPSKPAGRPPKRKPEIRFDLDKGKEPVQQKPRLPPPRHLTKRESEEEKAAARAARIAELKQKAQDANRRAKARAKRDAGKPE